MERGSKYNRLWHPLTIVCPLFFSPSPSPYGPILTVASRRWRGGWGVRTNAPSHDRADADPPRGDARAADCAGAVGVGDGVRRARAAGIWVLCGADADIAALRRYLHARAARGEGRRADVRRRAERPVHRADPRCA